MIGQNVPPGQTPQSNEEELKKRQQGAITPSAAQKRGTGFTNIQQYLKSSAPAGQAIASRVGGTVAEQQKAAEEATTEAEKVRQGIEATKGKVLGASNVARTIERIGTGQGEISDLEKEAQDANYYTSGQYLREKEAAEKAAKEKGAAASAAIGTLGQTAKQLGSEEGQYGILSKLYKGPTYGAGQQRLDQMLLQGTAGSALSQLLGGATKSAAEQAKALGTTTSQAIQGLQDIGTLGRAGQASIQSALQTAQGTIGTAQETEAATRTKTAAAEKAQIEADLIAAAEDMAKRTAELGTMQDVEIEQGVADRYKKLTGLDIAESPIYNIFGTGKVDEKVKQNIRDLLTSQVLKAKDVVTEDDLKRMQALEKLGAGKSAFTEAAGPLAQYGVTSTLQDARDKAMADFLKATQQDITGTGKHVYKVWDDLGLSSSKRTERATASVNLFNELMKELPPEQQEYIQNLMEKGQALTPKVGSNVQVGTPFIQTNLDGLTNPMDPYGDVGERIGSALWSGAENIRKGIGSFIDQFSNVTENKEARISEAKGKAEARAQADLRSKIEKLLKEQGYGRKIKIKPSTPTEVK